MIKGRLKLVFSFSADLFGRKRAGFLL